MKFKNYFNAHDINGVRHTGFLQSMDFSALTTDITMLNELTMSIIDAHLYNELSGSLVMRQWRAYMTYNKDNERHEIVAQFYTDFVNALAAKLYRKESWFKLLSTDFKSLSATDIKTIIHGTKETDRDYGQAETTREYGEDETETEYGATETATEYGATETATEYGATETATEYGAKLNTKQYARVEVTVTRDMDTHVIGATQTDTDATTTNKLYPLGAAAYVDDTQSITDQTVTTNSQSNTDTWGDQETATAARTDTDADALHTDTTTGKLHTDTTTETLHTDTTTEALHTDTTTRAARTDTETKAARKDTETIKTYTDTEQHVKHILIAPEKFFEIEKELADIGVYDLMLDAVKETMLLSVWDEEDGFVW